MQINGGVILNSQPMKTTTIFTLILFFLFLNQNSILANENLGSKIYEKAYQIAPGVTLQKDNFETTQNTRRAINYMTVDLNDPTVSLQLALGNPINQLSKITDLGFRETQLGSRNVVGSINASFFLTNGSGMPANLVVKNNEILRLGRTSSTPNDPIYYRNAFGIKADGKPQIGDYQEKIQLHVNNMTLPIGSYNTVRHSDKIILFTPSLGYNVPKIDNNFSTEIIVKNASKDTSTLSFGDEITGVVSEVSRNNNGTSSVIPNDGFVIAANGEAFMNQLANVKPGDNIKVTLTIDDKWMNSQSMIATGPLLVKDGKVAIGMNESSSFAKSLHPRSAVGITMDNKLILVTVDGRKLGYSNGISIGDLAQYMISLGAVQAINLDGGNSTTMAARLAGHDFAYLVNRPSAGVERRVSNALQIISTIPQIKVANQVSVLEQFPNIKNWEATTVLATASTSLSGGAAKAIIGNNSAKLTYDFITNLEGNKETAAAYLTAKQPLLLEGKPLKIGMWVHGDDNENWLRLQISDRNLKLHTVNFTNENQLNWFGWRYVTAEIPQSIAAPYSIQKIYIAQTQETKKAKGALYFDQLEVIYDPNFEIPKTEFPAIMDVQFPDVGTGHWSLRNVNHLANQGVITGFPNGEFQPDGKLTREQVAIMLVRQLNLNTDNRQELDFKDVAKESYAYAAIAAVAEEGLLTGRRPGYFDPKEPLTRAEAATVLKRAYQLVGGEEKSFPDSATHWAQKEIGTLVENQITTGYIDGTFKPDQSAVRAEFAAFIYRVIKG